MKISFWMPPNNWIKNNLGVNSQIFRLIKLGKTEQISFTFVGK